ncbi:hypothetical protein SASPL_124143 [Salvia splendens]|uniref:Glabrous enhancer-binding protein-like DBD domain-containing protein n=1 Tax=Salvia splendens TaxID=180675 RepID=A0A8X8XPY1_SALSN|nr:hypothetical protein SASPL_124143 [Salvia splendens]
MSTWDSAWGRHDVPAFSDTPRYDYYRQVQPRYLDPTPPQNKPQPQIPAAKPSQPLPHPSSSDEDDSGSETVSESDASEVRPLAAKPDEKTLKSNRKAKSKPAADPVPPGKSAAASKRPAEDTTSKNAKKPKKSLAAEPETAEKKSNMFQRLWSEEDEIVILEGMIEFHNKFKVDPLKRDSPDAADLHGAAGVAVRGGDVGAGAGRETLLAAFRADQLHQPVLEAVSAYPHRQRTRMLSARQLRHGGVVEFGHKMRECLSWADHRSWELQEELNRKPNCIVM